MMTINLFLKEPVRFRNKFTQSQCLFFGLFFLLFLLCFVSYSHNILLCEDGHAVVADFGGEISMKKTQMTSVSFFILSWCLILYDESEKAVHTDSYTFLSHSNFSDPES